MNWNFRLFQDGWGWGESAASEWNSHVARVGETRGRHTSFKGPVVCFLHDQTHAEVPLELTGTLPKREILVLR